MPLRIAYFGLPLGALRLAAHGFAPVVVGIGHTDALGMRRLRERLGTRALLLGRPDANDPAVQEILSSAKPDVLLSWFWPKRLPTPLLALPPRGAFGVHPSLLPRWRGPNPYFWALRSGDAQTGVTLHRLESEYDTGRIIGARPLDIRAQDNAWILARRLDRPSLALLVECARRLEAGEALEGEVQDEARVTLAPEPREEDLSVRWDSPVADILRLVRAASPTPGACAQLGEHLVELLDAEEAPLPSRSLRPSEALITAAGVLVVALDGAVLLRAARTEEGVLLEGAAIADLLRG